MSGTLRILVVEDEPAIRRGLLDVFAGESANYFFTELTFRY